MFTKDELALLESGCLEGEANCLALAHEMSNMPQLDTEARAAGVHLTLTRAQQYKDLAQKIHVFLLRR